MKFAAPPGEMTTTRKPALLARASVFAVRKAPLEHDPEKWKPVFRKDHAQTKS